MKISQPLSSFFRFLTITHAHLRFRHLMIACLYWIMWTWNALYFFFKCMKYFIFRKRVCTQMHCKCYFWKNMKYPIISCIKERNFWSALGLTITYSPLPNENYNKSSVPIVIIKEWHVLLFEISWLVFIPRK